MLIHVDGGGGDGDGWGKSRRRKEEEEEEWGRKRKKVPIIIIIFILKWYDEGIHSLSYLVLPIRLTYRRGEGGHFCSFFQTRKMRLRAVE